MTSAGNFTESISSMNSINTTLFSLISQLVSISMLAPRTEIICVRKEGAMPRRVNGDVDRHGNSVIVPMFHSGVLTSIVRYQTTSGLYQLIVN